MRATVGSLQATTGVSFMIPDHAAQRIVSQGGSRLLSMDIAGDTRRALFRALAESRVQGLHPSSAATRRLIQEHVTAGRFVNAGPRYRARLIARTETMVSTNQAMLRDERGQSCR